LFGVAALGSLLLDIGLFELSHFGVGSGPFGRGSLCVLGPLLGKCRHATGYRGLNEGFTFLLGDDRRRLIVGGGRGTPAVAIGAGRFGNRGSQRLRRRNGKDFVLAKRLDDVRACRRVFSFNPSQNLATMLVERVRVGVALKRQAGKSCRVGRRTNGDIRSCRRQWQLGGWPIGYRDTIADWRIDGLGCARMLRSRGRRVLELVTCLGCLTTNRRRNSAKRAEQLGGR
jgi:hypothetical protein